MIYTICFHLKLYLLLTVDCIGWKFQKEQGIKEDAPILTYCISSFVPQHHLYHSNVLRATIVMYSVIVFSYTQKCTHTCVHEVCCMTYLPRYPSCTLTVGSTLLFPWKIPWLWLVSIVEGSSVDACIWQQYSIHKLKIVCK